MPRLKSGVFSFNPDGYQPPTVPLRKRGRKVIYHNNFYKSFKVFLLKILLKQF